MIISIAFLFGCSTIEKVQHHFPKNPKVWTGAATEQSLCNNSLTKPSTCMKTDSEEFDGFQCLTFENQAPVILAIEAADIVKAAVKALKDKQSALQSPEAEDN